MQLGAFDTLEEVALGRRDAELRIFGKWAPECLS